MSVFLSLRDRTSDEAVSFLASDIAFYCKAYRNALVRARMSESRFNRSANLSYAREVKKTLDALRRVAR